MRLIHNLKASLWSDGRACALMLGGLLTPAAALAQPPVPTTPPAEITAPAAATEAPAPDVPVAPAAPAPAVPAGSTFAAPPSPAPLPSPSATPTQETACQGGVDEDSDGMLDCADADCFGNPTCEAGQGDERTAAACSDWVDNDGDTAVDCEDDECNGVGPCQGSAQRHSTSTTAIESVGEDIPELGDGMSVQDLIGRGDDIDGERNDFLCADGLDNDNDGRTDCADFGCRFDPQVTVCQNSPSLRFSIVAGIGASYDFEAKDKNRAADVRFKRIQARVLGPIPMIQNSFFLLSTRLERSPRLTFAHFQVPLGDSGLYAAVNSGGGGLSSGLIVSTANQPLLDPPFYLYRAFEQGNGAAAEVGGNIGETGMRFRTFAAGGSGTSTGNVGGRFYSADDRNFTWALGAQLQLNIIGSFDQKDSPILYNPSAHAFGLVVGAKYDQRAAERYPAANLQLLWRYNRFLVRAEAYGKRELAYGAWQAAWNIQTSILIVPETLMFAADYGQFVSSEFEDTADYGTVDRPLDELQFRAALHWFWYRNIGLMSLMYSETHVEENPDSPADPTIERTLNLETQFRF